MRLRREEGTKDGRTRVRRVIKSALNIDLL